MAKKIQINKRGVADEDSIYDSPIDLPDDFGIITSPSIVKRDDGSLELSNIRIHRIGLEFVGAVSEEEYEIFGQTLLQIDTAYQWIVGDYLAYGVENNYGMAKDFAEALDRSEGTINNWVSISRQVRFSRRRENLSFKHHVEVAALSPDEQDHWLNQADENGWSAARLNREINGARLSDKPSPAIQLLERWQKAVNHTKWKTYSPSERESLKTALHKMLQDIETWENT